MSVAPAFWQHRGPLARVLAPLGLVTRVLTARRVARPGWAAPVPVICCGNAGVGGAGKTPLALDICARLQLRGLAVHVLTRGFGGAASGVIRVDASVHTAAQVGDEPLLLAARAPTWVGADRAAAARRAVAAGAEILVMDDGLQNPGLRKDFAVLVIDGGAGFGNGFLLPAGPLRERVVDAAARCQAAVLIGADLTGAADSLPARLPVIRAHLVPGAGIEHAAGQRVIAFAGIGRPEKFFAMLRDQGAILVAARGFADHHRYDARELAALRAAAARETAVLVTTEKDFVRLDAAQREGIQPIGVTLAWDDPAQIETLLDGVAR